MLLANTGVTKAGYLLKCCSESEWRSYLVLLNDHCISYCSEKQNFKYPERNILLSASTRVYKDEEETVMRIETGLDVLLFRGKDETEIKEWQRAIMMNVNRLPQLARGQFRVKYKGITKHVFLMLHRECITLHASASEPKIIKSYELTGSSGFQITKDKGIEFKSRRANSNILKINAQNDIEYNHFVFVLSSAISRLQSKSHTLAPPPQLPIHSGSLLCLTKGMKWKRQHIVLTQEGNIYMHHRFDNPVRYTLTPNSLVINTTLKQHSFELVLFSTSLHLSASSEAEKAEWIYILQAQIPMSNYDESDQLQAAALGQDLEYATVEFHCDTSPGLLLEKRGSFYMTTLVSDKISRTVCSGSIVSHIGDTTVMTEDFDSIIKTLNEWNPPLKLTFALSPRKMGWLQLMKPPSTSWKDAMIGRKNKRSNSGAIWEKVYGTLSSGVLTFYSIKRDGKSCKKVVHLLGSAIGLVDSGDVNGRRGCFKVLVNGIESIYLQADCLDSQLSWAVALCQSISLQNGGGLILDRERKMTTHVAEAETSMINLDELPIQSLRNEQQWLSIDKVSSVDAEEVVDYVSDFEEGHKRHVSATDFDTLLQCVSSSTV